MNKILNMIVIATLTMCLMSQNIKTQTIKTIANQTHYILYIEGKGVAPYSNPKLIVEKTIDYNDSISDTIPYELNMYIVKAGSSDCDPLYIRLNFDDKYTYESIGYRNDEATKWFLVFPFIDSSIEKQVYKLLYYIASSQKIVITLASECETNDFIFELNYPREEVFNFIETIVRLK